MASLRGAKRWIEAGLLSILAHVEHKGHSWCRQRNMSTDVKDAGRGGQHGDDAMQRRVS